MTFTPRFPGDTRLAQIKDTHTYKGGVGLTFVSKEQMRGDIEWLVDQLEGRGEDAPVTLSKTELEALRKHLDALGDESWPEIRRNPLPERLRKIFWPEAPTIP